MKFARVAALILGVSMVGAGIAACSNEPEPVSSDINVISTQGQNAGSETSGAADADNAASENYVFVYSGVNFIVNADIDESGFTEGTDFEVTEVASCAGQGMASLYTFKGGSFSVETVDRKSVV